MESVGLYGVAFTKSQVRQLSEFPVRVVCLDSDGPGRKASSELCKALSCFPGETYRVRLDGHDPASCSKEEIQDLRRRFL